MNINQFADLNVKRCYSPEAAAKWGDTSKRDLTDWALCMGGEAGEVLRAVKKLEMYVNDSDKIERRRSDVIDEVSDVMTYCVLLLRYMGVDDIEAALMNKFNVVSARIGWTEALTSSSKPK